MSTSPFLRRLAILVAVAVSVAVVAVVRFVGPFRDRPRATTPPPAVPVQPVPVQPPPSEPRPVATPDQAKPVYEGLLGEFLVTPRRGGEIPPCPRPLRPAKNEKIKASELYSPVFGDNLEGFVAECADGKIVAIEIYGPEIIGRGYFVGKPTVPYEAPLDRLKLLTVAGKPAIAELPMSGFSWPLRLAVIERFPSGDQPGIAVGTDNTDKSLEEAIELAAQIMGVRP